MTALLHYLSPELSWKEIWPLIDSVEGWLTETEARTLYELARKPDVRQIVELGSYKGRSATALGYGYAQNESTEDGFCIWAVDLWSDNNVLESFRSTIKQRGLGNLLVTFSSNTSAAAYSWMQKKPLHKVDLVFIDGDHSYEGCRADFEAWAPLVRTGGFVAFHDNWAPGPSRVIRELPGWFEKVAERETLTVVQKR